MPLPEIDDLEFERLLEKMIDLWPHKDTMQMSHILGVNEAKIAYILSCMMEGNYNWAEEEKANEKLPSHVSE